MPDGSVMGAMAGKALAIVDDEPFMQELLLDMLQEQGFALTAFGTGRTFLASHGRACYDAVVLDLSLPDVDGFETLECMARINTSTHILLISGHAQATVAAALLYAQGLGFQNASMLCKPFSRMELLLALQLHDADSGPGPLDGASQTDPP